MSTEKPPFTDHSVTLTQMAHLIWTSDLCLHVSAKFPPFLWPQCALWYSLSHRCRLHNGHSWSITSYKCVLSEWPQEVRDYYTLGPNANTHTHLYSADPSRLWGLRKTFCVAGGGWRLEGGCLEWKNGWNGFCPRFSPCRIVLTEHAREIVSFAVRSFFMQETVRCSRYMIWLTFYVERVTAHHIKIMYHSCFHNRWPTSKTKPKWKYRWDQGPLVFCGPYTACVFCVKGRLTPYLYSYHYGDIA